MNFLFPIFATVFQAGSSTLDKIILSIHRIDFRTYTGISFPLIFILNLIIFLIFRPAVPQELWNIHWIGLLLAAVALSIFGNLIYYRALQNDHLSEIKTIEIFGSIPVILFATLFFSDERNPFIIVPALISALALIWSHYRKEHFVIARHTAPLLAWAIMVAPVSAAIAKEVVHVFSPILFELVINGAVAFVLGPLFIRYERRASERTFFLLVLTNLLTTIAWILFYFSYQRSGIVYTALVFSLEPALVYLAAILFLKERVEWRKTIAFGIIIVSVAFAQIMA